MPRARISSRLRRLDAVLVVGAEYECLLACEATRWTEQPITVRVVAQPSQRFVGIAPGGSGVRIATVLCAVPGESAPRPVAVERFDRREWVA